MGTRAIVVALAAAAAIGLAGCGDDPGPSGGDGGSAGADAGRDPDAGGARDDGGGVGDDGGVGGDAGGGADAGAADGGGPVSMPCTASGSCDPFDPTSCGAQACRRGMMGAECMDVITTPLAPGEACDRPDQCPRGTMCLNFGGGFHCERMCPEGSIGFCGAGSACTGTIGDTCIQICRPIAEACDIYAQDCADPSDTCTLATNPETGAPYTGCRPAGPRGAGETCGGTDGTCGHDLICIRVDMVATCRQPCDPDASVDECPSGQACTGTARTWMVGYCADVP